MEGGVGEKHERVLLPAFRSSCCCWRKRRDFLEVKAPPSIDRRHPSLWCVGMTGGKPLTHRNRLMARWAWSSLVTLWRLVSPSSLPLSGRSAALAFIVSLATAGIELIRRSSRRRRRQGVLVVSLSSLIVRLFLRSLQLYSAAVTDRQTQVIPATHNKHKMLLLLLLSVQVLESPPPPSLLPPPPRLLKQV